MLKPVALSILCLGLCALSAPTRAASTPTPSSLTAMPAPRPATNKVTPKDAPPKDGRLERDVVPTRQAIDLVVDPAQEGYRGSVVIDVDVKSPRTTLWLHARKMTVTKAVVTASGKSQDGTFVIVDDVEGLAALRVAAPVSGAVTVRLEFEARFHDDLVALYRVKAGDDWYVFTQFEALSAREAFPCFDEPGFKIPFAVSVTHPSHVTAIGNTKTTSAVKGAAENGKEASTKSTFAPTKPLPTYLLALVVGPVDVIDGGTVAPTLDRPEPLPVRAITVKGKGALVKSTLKDTIAVVVDQERAFGIGYPYDKLDIVAVPDFGAGAMENAGLVTFRDSLLFVDSKSPIGAQKSSLNVIAHELAHQWFGNLVTMAWWDDLWLNEAFATWFASRTVHRLRPDFDGNTDLRQTANRAMGEDSLVSARQIRQPILNRGDISNAFDGITYSKGAGVITMFEEYIDRDKGKGTFLKGVSAYLTAHRFGSGTTKDFLAAISQAAGFDIAPAFSTFLDQPGVPLVQASCAVNDKTGGPPTVSVSTTRFLPVGSTGDKNKQWDIPICLSSGLGEKTPVVTCALVKSGTGRIELPLPAGQAQGGKRACPKAVHPNADGAGYYRFAMPGAELQALAKTTASMSTGERLSFSSALRAGFSAATSDFQATLAAATALAGDSEPGVALTASGLLWFARETVLDDDGARARVRAQTTKLYQPHLNKLGFVDRKKDTPLDRERRAALFGTVVNAGGPPLKVAVAAGRQIFNTGKTTQLAQDLWPTALWAAVEHGDIDAATWDAWLKSTKAEPDPRLRSWRLRALASTTKPALSKKALELVFDADLRVNEKTAGLWSQVSDRRTIDGAFAFITTRYDDITAKLPEDWRPGLAEAFSGYCDESKAKAVEGFFAPKVKTTPGLERALAQGLEEIRLCVAKKAAHAESVKKAFPK